MTKTPIEIAIEEGQKCLKCSPVIVLGSGASVPFGLPSMNALAHCLSHSTLNFEATVSENKLWAQFLADLQRKDLETVLSSLKLTDRLSDHIINTTWSFVRCEDDKVLQKIILGDCCLPLTRLYQHLFRSTVRTLSVVTPNYDRLAEYAADVADCCHYTGFSYGYIRKRQSGGRLSIQKGARTARVVDIWKVHGCLDWFIDESGQSIAITSAKDVPLRYHPAIVTPGIEKYERTHLEPFRTILSGADDALSRASAYLCVGFGFNDLHIQPKLMERWKSNEAILVILTKTVSESAKRMLAGANGQRFLALEESTNGTQMWSHQFPEGIELEGVNLWKLTEFLDRTI